MGRSKEEGIEQAGELGERLRAKGISYIHEPHRESCSDRRNTGQIFFDRGFY